MPNPKRRHSKARTAKRRAHDHLKAPGLSLCPNCHEPKLSHRVCPRAATTRASRWWKWRKSEQASAA